MQKGRNGYIRIRRLETDEKIRPNDFHSVDNGKTLMPIINIETIGQTPNDFKREFWRILQISCDDFSLWDDEN